MRHHMTFYEEDGVRYVESWLQINIFNKCYCFSKIKREVKHSDTTIRLGGKQLADGLIRQVHV